MNAPTQTPPPPAPLVVLARSVDRWAARRHWLTKRSVGMSVLDIVLLLVFLIALFAPALPMSWFTANDPVYTARGLLVPSSETGEVVAPVGEPFPVVDRQSYRLKVWTSSNPNAFLQVMSSSGKPIHGWQESVSYAPNGLDVHFRTKGENAAGPVHFQVTIKPSLIGHTLPYQADRIEVFAFNRIYFELRRARGWLVLVLLVVLSVYFYPRHLSPLLLGSGGPRYAAIARGLDAMALWLHGKTGSLHHWRRWEQPDEEEQK